MTMAEMIIKIDNLIDYASNEKLQSIDDMTKKYWDGYIQALFDVKELLKQLGLDNDKDE